MGQTLLMRQQMKVLLSLLGTDLPPGRESV
jgi:hypothetical protein